MFVFLRPSSTFRCFSSSARAIVYAENGDPSKVLSVLTYPAPQSPPPNAVNLRFLLSPVNPADINVVEGVYPTKPTKADLLSLPGRDKPFFVGGNEGLARVTALGDGVDSLSVGDWVIMLKQQAGTWATDRTVSVKDVVRLPDVDSLTEAQAATLTVPFSLLSCPSKSLNASDAAGQSTNSIQHVVRLRRPQGRGLGHPERRK